MIDLQNLEKNKVSTQLNGYPVVFIGETGVGKTYSMLKYLQSIAPKGKEPLFLMFEDRHKAIEDIMAVRITSIADLYSVKAQLNNPSVREKFSCVVIDTIDKFEEMASRYTANNKNVEISEDLQFGKGNKYINGIIGIVSEIRNLGLPVHFIAQTLTEENIITKDVTTKVKLKKETKGQIFHDAFLVGIVLPDKNANGNIDADRTITFKKTSRYIDLKDTFGLPDVVKIGDLKTTLEKVIGKKYKKENITNKEVLEEIKDESENFNELLTETKNIGSLLVQNNLQNEALSILQTNLGVDEQGKVLDLNSLHKGQIDLLKVVNLKLKEIATQNNLIK